MITNTQVLPDGNALPQNDAVADAVKAQNAVTAATNAASRSSRKAPSAFRTISEVATDLNVQQHVLRFWETKFTQIKPLKRGGGRRYYRPEDVALIRRIHHLLYTEGYTIKGVQKLIKGQSPRQFVERAPAPSMVADIQLQPVVEPPAVEPPAAQLAVSGKQRLILQAMLGDLKELREMIRKA